MGPAMVSDVQSHGPLVVMDGITESGQAYRIAKHYSIAEVTIVLGEHEPGEGPGAAVEAE
jgi:hypothetical protein